MAITHIKTVYLDGSDDLVVHKGIYMTQEARFEEMCEEMGRRIHQHANDNGATADVGKQNSNNPQP